MHLSSNNEVEKAQKSRKDHCLTICSRKIHILSWNASLKVQIKLIFRDDSCICNFIGINFSLNLRKTIRFLIFKL